MLEDLESEAWGRGSYDKSCLCIDWSVTLPEKPREMDFHNAEGPVQFLNHVLLVLSAGAALHLSWPRPVVTSIQTKHHPSVVPSNRNASRHSIIPSEPHGLHPIALSYIRHSHHSSIQAYLNQVIRHNS